MIPWRYDCLVNSLKVLAPKFIRQCKNGLPVIASRIQLPGWIWLKSKEHPVNASGA